VPPFPREVYRKVERKQVSFTSRLQNSLKDYIQFTGSPEEKQKMRMELQAQLPSPAFAASCEFIPPEHPLRRDAYIVSDAFEAVTNGMFSPELENGLSGVPEDSLLAPWVSLTRSVLAFYQNDFRTCLALMETIPEETAPAVYRDFFFAILRGNREECPEHWHLLRHAVLDDREDLKSSLDQLKEASLAGMEDVMLETADMIIRDIIREQPETAERIIIWCLHQIQELDVLSDKAADRIRRLFGDARGLRLTALATLSYDQDRSLIYWLLALQAYLKENKTTPEEVRAYLSIISDVSETVALEFELTTEYMSLLGTSIRSLTASLKHLYPDMVRGVNTEKPPLEIIRSLAGEKEKILPPTHRKVTQNNNAPVQLELFSF